MSTSLADLPTDPAAVLEDIKARYSLPPRECHLSSKGTLLASHYPHGSGCGHVREHLVKAMLRKEPEHAYIPSALHSGPLGQRLAAMSYSGNTQSKWDGIKRSNPGLPNSSYPAG